MRTRSRHILVALLTTLVACPAGRASAADVKSLAACTVAVFDEIGRTQRWSGKAPGACHGAVIVNKVADGVAVSAWTSEPADDGWARTSFTAVLDYAELAAKNARSVATRDVMARGAHLQRCLSSLKKSNDPLDCSVKGSRDYLASEESGVKDSQTIRLDDDGRLVVVEYQVAATVATPDEPADLEAPQPLPPGLVLKLGAKGGAAASTTGSTGQ